MPGPRPDDFASVADLDRAVTDGRVSFERYWVLRAALDEREQRDRDERAFDPVPPRGPDGIAAPVVGTDERFVPPPPVRIERTATAAHPAPLVPPPPPPTPYASGPVQLPAGTVAPAHAGADATRPQSGRRRRRRG